MTVNWDLLFKGIGSIGAVLSVYNLIIARRKEAAAKIEEEANFAMVAAFMSKPKIANAKDVESRIAVFEVGSAEWKRAEKLVERGVLERAPQGRGYCLAGTFVK